jgi:putative addiction module component (TIGR02574 family)
MIQTVDDLAQCATELPPEQRFTLARRILESVEPEGNAGIDSTWALEIRERIRRYDCGEIGGIPAAEVFGELVKRRAR